MNEFNAVKVKDELIEWILKWFCYNGRGCNAIVGISGGKDSSVVAALLCEALGANRVIGVMMPNDTQSDIDDSYKLIEHLGIKYCKVDIYDSVKALLDNIDSIYSNTDNAWEYINISEQTNINLPARIRMSTLYAIAQSTNGRVANTCNLSEDYVGYSTRYGDSAGDFSPLGNLTVTEVKAIGKVLGLPDELINKTPSDGLCGKSDEDNLGFTYDELDTYIKTGKATKMIKNRIDYLHKRNEFKLLPIPTFKYSE